MNTSFTHSNTHAIFVGMYKFMKLKCIHRFMKEEIGVRNEAK